MISTTKSIYAEEVDTHDQLDFDGDEYADNDQALYGYAVVERKTEWYDGQTGFPWVSLYTTQGIFDMPAGHLVKLKLDD